MMLLGPILGYLVFAGLGLSHATFWSDSICKLALNGILATTSDGFNNWTEEEKKRFVAENTAVFITKEANGKKCMLDLSNNAGTDDCGLQYIGNKCIIFTFHGWTGSHIDIFNNATAKGNEMGKNCVLFQFDYENIAKNYNLLIKSIQYIGNYIGENLKKLVFDKYGINKGSCEFVAFSAGCPIAGKVGLVLKGEIGTLYALDHAFPNIPEKLYVNPTCAKKVVVLHCTSILGVSKALGGVDLYVNTLDNQPQCQQFSTSLIPCQEQFCCHINCVRAMYVLLAGKSLPAKKYDSAPYSFSYNLQSTVPDGDYILEFVGCLLDPKYSCPSSDPFALKN